MKGFNIRAVLGLDSKPFGRGMQRASGMLGRFNKMLRTTNDVMRG